MASQSRDNLISQPDTGSPTRESKTQHAEDAIERDPRLQVISRLPFNAESPLEQQQELLTPTHLFYVRSHFPVPRLSVETWKLSVGGMVEHPFVLGYDELRALPARELTATLECAGNGRRGFSPPAAGEQWGWGAVSTARWRGVPLGVVLERAGIESGVSELLFVGADAGEVPDAGGEISFARSLPLVAADGDAALLAYEMNGELLTPDHGFPLRLIVPGWYGVASVKWLARIEALGEPFQGFYQRDRYVMRLPGSDETTPLTRMAVRSVIVDPLPNSALSAGRHVIRGFAWSGTTPIARVEVDTLDYPAVPPEVVRADPEAPQGEWQVATLLSTPEPFAWTPWEFHWHAGNTGSALLRSRAFERTGHGQPEQPVWNALGYCNNAVQSIIVTVN